MGWTYIVMVVSQVLADLDLTLAAWGSLWSAVSFGTMLSAIVGGALGDRFGIRRIVGLGVVLMGTTFEGQNGTDGSEGTEPKLGAVAAVQKVLRVRDVWIVAVCYMLFLGGYIGIIGYAPTYFVAEQGMTPAASGFVISLIMWAFVAGSLILPALSDRVGLRKIFYFPGMLAAGMCMMLAAYATEISLWLVAIVWGLMGGVASIAFVVPLEMDGVGPLLAGSAVGVALTAGYLGGVLSPIIGMSLVAMNPVVGFVFWGGCFALSACLFLVLKETGPRA